MEVNKIKVDERGFRGGGGGGFLFTREIEQKRFGSIRILFSNLCNLSEFKKKRMKFLRS